MALVDLRAPARAALAALALLSSPALAAPPPLLPAAAVQAIAGELSGTAAKRNVQALTLQHRMRGSRGFHAAADFVATEARRFGLADVQILSFPADGAIFYGTQRSRPAWDADFAELWEQRPVGAMGAESPATALGAESPATAPGGENPAAAGAEHPAAGAGTLVDAERIASWEARPVTLAEDSASGEAAAPLVDVGRGSAEADYQGKEVRGRLVLAAAQADAVAPLAVERFGAAGIVSYAQNQPTAWSGEDETLVRWGHLPSFPKAPTFAFMVSLKQARAWQRRMAAGETIHLRASVRAGRHPGRYEVATGVLPGADPALRGEEIVLSCHLDHERPGANDNASGCATILEVARALSTLVRAGRLAPPRRTLRWIWPAEVEGTLAFLNGRPDLAARARAVVHLDMVGGDPAATGAVLHVTRSPASLPSFVDDVGEAFARFANEESYAYAATGEAAYPLVDPEGGKGALQAEVADFTPGSDHEVWSEGSWRVPAIYLNDWPDRTIHTHADALANIDATKLLRAAFVAAASAYRLATLDGAAAPALWEEVRRHALERTARALGRAQEIRAAAPADAAHLMAFRFRSERRIAASIAGFAPLSDGLRAESAAFLDGLERLAAVAPAPAPASDDSPVYRRRPSPKGPLTGFGYSYLSDRLARQGLAAPALLARQGRWGDGALYAYEALNLVDGERSARQVRDDLAAIYGPLPEAEVAAYLEALARIGILDRRPPAPAR